MIDHAIVSHIFLPGEKLSDHNTITLGHEISYGVKRTTNDTIMLGYATVNHIDFLTGQ